MRGGGGEEENKLPGQNRGSEGSFYLRDVHNNCETLSIVTPPSVRFLLELFITGFSCLVVTMFLSAGELVAKIISKSSETNRRGEAKHRRVEIFFLLRNHETTTILSREYFNGSNIFFFYFLFPFLVLLHLHVSSRTIHPSFI